MTDIAASGQVLLDKYQVRELLGEGGMGLVYRARHVHLKQDVALKFLQPSLIQRADAVERFLREARAMAQLKSEHVARVMDVAKLDNGVPYLVMEFLHGVDLHTLLERGPLPVEVAVEYVLQACEAVAEAHALGIVHRDLKPSNLFLTRRRDQSPLIKVLDFGISKIPLDEDGELGPIVTATNSVIGSPRYMSPEQIRSAKSVDARADIWSLGVVLHELVTGNHPFPAETPWDTMARILSHPPIALRSQRPDVPPEIEGIVLRCLEKERDERYADVGSFAAALAALGPAHARGLAERARGTLNPTPTALAAAAPGAPVPELDAGAPSGPPISSMPTGSTLTDANWGASAKPPAWRRGRVLAGAGVLGLGVLVVGVAAVIGSGGAEPELPSLGARSEDATLPSAAVIRPPATARAAEPPALTAPTDASAPALSGAAEPNPGLGARALGPSAVAPPTPTPRIEPAAPVASAASSVAQPPAAPRRPGAPPTSIAPKPAPAAQKSATAPAARPPATPVVTPATTAPKPPPAAKPRPQKPEDILKRRVYSSDAR